MAYLIDEKSIYTVKINPKKQSESNNTYLYVLIPSVSAVTAGAIYFIKKKTKKKKKTD